MGQISSIENLLTFEDKTEIDALSALGPLETWIYGDDEYFNWKMIITSIKKN
jgi:hypothetical protein